MWVASRRCSSVATLGGTPAISQLVVASDRALRVDVGRVGGGQACGARESPSSARIVSHLGSVGLLTAVAAVVALLDRLSSFSPPGLAPKTPNHWGGGV